MYFLLHPLYLSAFNLIYVVAGKVPSFLNRRVAISFSDWMFLSKLWQRTSLNLAILSWKSSIRRLRQINKHLLGDSGTPVKFFHKVLSTSQILFVVCRHSLLFKGTLITRSALVLLELKWSNADLKFKQEQNPKLEQRLLSHKTSPCFLISLKSLM